MMKWIWFIAAIIVSALILTCVARHAQEYADGPGKKHQIMQDQQFQTAEDMLRDFPTAAGKKK